MVVYIVFLVVLALWTGSGVFDSISSHPAWAADPVGYTRGYRPPPGSVNPWPMLTALMALCTIAGLVALARYRGPGHREAIIVLAGVFAVLVATGAYFVPTLIRLADHAALTDAQITSMARTWMTLNVIRIVLVLALLTYGLVSLTRLAQARE